MGTVKKTVWLMSMAILVLALYAILIARLNVSQTDVIFGDSDSVYVGNELASYSDPDAVVDTVDDDGYDWPDIDITLAQYALVNTKNLLSSAYEPDLALQEDGETYEPIHGTRYQAFAALGKPYLDQMLTDMEELGFTPYIASSYRTYSYQSQLFNTKAFGIFMEMGYTNADYDEYFEDTESEVYLAYQKAAEKAQSYTAPAGASEHQLGLAVDIWDMPRQSLGSYSYLDEDFRNWLEENAWQYGFIQRYPTKKLLRTGWDEPWHYRYVGVEVAKFIKETGMCYEEFYVHYMPDADV